MLLPGRRSSAAEAGAEKTVCSPAPFCSFSWKPSFSISKTERSFFLIRSMMALMSFSSKGASFPEVGETLGKAVLPTGSSDRSPLGSADVSLCEIAERRRRQPRRSSSPASPGGRRLRCHGAVAHDPAIAHLDQARGHRRHFRAVGDQNQGRQLFLRNPRSSSSTRSADAVSRFPVGSSAIRSDGRCTSARAIAVRCCSPPLSWCTKCAALFVRPTEPASRRPRGRFGTARPGGAREADIFERVHRREEIEKLEDEPELAATEVGQGRIVRGR